MNFKRTLKEEKFEANGRCVLAVSLCVSAPDGEGGAGAPAERRMQDSLLELSAFLFEEAKDGYFRAARERAESCEREGARVYPYRLSVDISPEKVLPARACIKGGKKRKGKRFFCSDAGCILYKVSLRLFYRGKVIAKGEKRFAFRLSDGYVCPMGKL